MKQLLEETIEALVLWTPRVDGVHIKNSLIEKLRAVIDAPEQEPAGYFCEVTEYGETCWREVPKEDRVLLDSIPLYTKPQPVAELTDDEIVKIAIASRGAEPGRDGYILPLTFARAVLTAQKGKK